MAVGMEKMRRPNKNFIERLLRVFPVGKRWETVSVHRRKPITRTSGFTLAELLIALAILGVIATFAIPKILNAQQNNQKVAAAKEVASIFTGAYQTAKLAGVITSSSKSSDLIPYINYTKLDTSGTVIDSVPGVASETCSSSEPCVKLHNGGTIQFKNESFAGTTANNIIQIIFDPDPANNTTSTADGPLKAIEFTLYYNGQLTTRGQWKNPTLSSNGVDTGGPNPTIDPSWFSWN